jgi:RNA polymerase sigma-70 factor (ECF subfamily)
MGSISVAPKATYSDYDALFTAEWSGLVRYFHGAVRDEGLAQDLAQEAFLRAARGLATFRGDCSPKTWLRRIAANVLHDHWRSRGTNDPASVHSGPADGDLARLDPQASPALTAERREVQACLASLLAELPPGEREALVLAAGDDLPPRDIARNLGLAPEAARARLHRARRRMAALVTDRCILVTDEGGGLSCDTRAPGPPSVAMPSP